MSKEKYKTILQSMNEYTEGLEGRYNRYLVSEMAKIKGDTFKFSDLRRINEQLGKGIRE